MDDLEEDYKIEKMKRLKKSWMSLLLSPFIIHLFLIKFLMHLLIFKHKLVAKQAYRNDKNMFKIIIILSVKY